MKFSRLQNMEVKNNLETGVTLKSFFKNNVAKKFFKMKSFGMQDGGCLLLALFLKKVADDLNLKSEIVYFGRSEKIQDHYVLKISETKHIEDLYIDSDGIQSKLEMIEKLKEFEFINTSLFENVNLSLVDSEIDKDPEFVNFLYKDFGASVKDILKGLL